MEQTKEIILKIENEKVWFNETDFIDFEKTDIPFEHLRFQKHRQIYWKVKMIAFDKDSRKLNVEIINYSHIDLPKFKSQIPKQEVKSLVFSKFDWRYLEQFLTYYHEKEIKGLLLNYDEKPIDINGDNNQSWNKKTVEFNYVPNQYLNPFHSSFEEEFKVEFNDLQFINGNVVFSRFIKRINKNIEFKISNDAILEEFNTIKTWFSKKLQTKKISVCGTIKLQNDEFFEAKATSLEINQIDENFITGVKINRTLELKKTKRPITVSKALFTAEDLFSLDTKNDLVGNVFGQTEDNIFQLFIDDDKLRNKRQLQFLSKEKQSLKRSIKFTNNPNFGFIFTVEGKNSTHFVWELLNSHATYIWSIVNNNIDSELLYNQIEAIINTILEIGRDEYKKEFKTKNQTNIFKFNPIYHSDKNSLTEVDFLKWKQQVTEILEN